MSAAREKVESHLVQWLHNRALISLIPPSHNDWIVTVAFYTAVHAIDAALAFDGIVVSNHDSRFTAVNKTHRFVAVRRPLQALYNLSRTVRYSANTTRWIPLLDIDKQVLKRNLLPLENSVLKLIDREIERPPITIASGPAPTTPAT